MAYPEPTPVIKSRNSEEFRQRLREFELSDSQRRCYKEAFKAFERNDKGKAKRRKP